MIALTPGEYQILRGCFTDYYRPLVDFLVASGARFSEAAALTPADVDRDEFEEYLQLPKVTQFKCSDLRHACFCRSVCLFDSLPTAAALRLTGGGRVEAGVWPAVVEG